MRLFSFSGPRRARKCGRQGYLYMKTFFFLSTLFLLSFSAARADEPPGCALETTLPARALKFFGTKRLEGSGANIYFDDYLWHVNGPVYCRLQTTPFDRSLPKAACSFNERQVQDCYVKGGR